MKITEKIHQLQQRPYEQRVRILKILIAVVALLIVGVWVLTMGLRKGPQSKADKIFSPMIEELKQLKNGKK